MRNFHSTIKFPGATMYQSERITEWVDASIDRAWEECDSDTQEEVEQWLDGEVAGIIENACHNFPYNTTFCCGGEFEATVRGLLEDRLPAVAYNAFHGHKSLDY